MSKEPCRVLITGAAGQIGYIISHWVASGFLFDDRKVILHLLDIEPAKDRLEGLCMELTDCAFHSLAGIVATTKHEEAFKDIEVAFLIASLPLKQGEVRRNLLEKNAPIFKQTGQSLGKWAKPNCRVLVIGNPNNTNAYLAMKYAAPKLGPKNFASLSMLDHNRVISTIAGKMGVRNEDVFDCMVWGNHGESQVPDVTNCYVKKDGKKIMVKDALGEAYIYGDFIKHIASRAWQVMEKRGMTSAASPTVSSVQHMRAWINGTREGEVLSLGIPVPDNGPYGIKPGRGIFFSFPCTVDKKGEVHVKEGYKLTPKIQELLKATEKDLHEEADIADKAAEASK